MDITDNTPRTIMTFPEFCYWWAESKFDISNSSLRNQFREFLPSLDKDDYESLQNDLYTFYAKLHNKGSSFIYPGSLSYKCLDHCCHCWKLLSINKSRIKPILCYKYYLKKYKLDLCYLTSSGKCFSIYHFHNELDFLDNPAKQNNILERRLEKVDYICKIPPII